ncbi:MAG: oxygen-independent coproporphyrinogen III oxidase [Vampirovibrionales bacterium]|nr:oxygen-independent coproporphyrinogen III oxidase [Vampirovibrionales bacterium]
MYHRLKALLPSYATSGPRYTSYPTVPVWQNWPERSDLERWHHVLADSNAPVIRSGTSEDKPPLALYVHLPFCEQRCLFCGCNVVITQKREQSQKYLDALFTEIDATLPLLDLSRPVEQIHWGGGTPTYLTPHQLDALAQFLADRFSILPSAEIALEVDPRVTSAEQLAVLRKQGFNRISLGVQDFDPLVQETIHRVQSLAQTSTLIQSARDLGYGGVNLDLIYGLPHQTAGSFAETVKTVIDLNPDRIALYHYAHVPWMAPHQAQMPEAAIPNSETKIEIFTDALEALSQAGYVYIGMDHFAKPQDELAKALEKGQLHRNFMGYTVRNTQSSHLLGFGVSAISDFGVGYAQNHRKLATYYEALTEKLTPPVFRGVYLTPDDHVRRAVIQALLCQGRLAFESIENTFLPVLHAGGFETYFAKSLQALKQPMQDGLIEAGDRVLTLTPLGRVLARNVAMAFDAYLPAENVAAEKQFSKTV